MTFIIIQTTNNTVYACKSFKPLNALKLPYSFLCNGQKITINQNDVLLYLTKDCENNTGQGWKKGTKYGTKTIRDNSELLIKKFDQLIKRSPICEVEPWN